MRFPRALPTARQERIRQDTGSRVRGGGISEADKADDRASLALPYVSRIRLTYGEPARVCVCVQHYVSTTKRNESERERTRGHYWILSIPGVIKIRSQSRGTQWRGFRGEGRGWKDPDRVHEKPRLKEG